MPKRTRAGTVLVRWTQRLGNEADLTGRAVDGSLAASMLMRGTERRTRQELTDELARLQTQMFVFGSATIASANIETTRDNLPAVLALLGGGPSRARVRPAGTRAPQARAAGHLREPAHGARAPRQHRVPAAHDPKPPEHPHYTRTFEESIAAVEAATLEDVRGFYRDFYGAGSGGNLTVLGDFDPDEVERAARELFSDRERRRPYRRVARTHHDAPPATIVIETPDKANAFLRAGLNIRMRDDHPDYPAMVLAGYLLGGGFLSSRLATRIRQQEGISYGVGASFSATPLDESGSFTAFAIYAPENAERLLAAFREEIDRALRDGFTDEEVESAKRGWMQQRDVARATDSQLAGTIHNGLFVERTLMYDAELEARVRALAPDEIGAALRRHVDPDRITVVRAGEFGEARASTNE